jgi:hypothetical protein
MMEPTLSTSTRRVAGSARPGAYGAMLDRAMRGPSSRWLAAALDQAEGFDPLEAAADAALLAALLPARAVEFLDDEQESLA